VSEVILPHVTDFIKSAACGVLDIIYPPFCLLCEADADYLCEECLDKITFIDVPVCPKCGYPKPVPGRCADCLVRDLSFDAARSAALFDGALRDAIHLFKYSGKIVLAEPLAKVMVDHWPGFGTSVDLVVPVPLHRARLNERGFNQSEELGRRLAGALGMPFGPRVVERIRNTRHQTNLPLDERTDNVAGAFRVKHQRAVRGKRVLVIDDVMTTGSTASAVADALESAGASRVMVYTLARGM
jgi:ComF family protein